MNAGRRHVLALSGALLAGLAGCVGDDATGDPTDTPTPTRTSTDGGTDTDSPTGAEFPDLDLVTDPDIDEARLARQVRGNVAFSLDLLGVLREGAPEENLFTSPYSVSVALAMTYAGARGETAEEMAAALHYELGGDHLHPAFAALEAEFARRNEDGAEVDVPTGPAGSEEDAGPAFRLSTANATWGQEGYPFREAFLDLLDAYYGAGLRLVDFSGSPGAARRRINDWVADHTDDRIPDLLPRDAIDATTRLVLTNAVHFVGMWRHPFDEDRTEPGPFTGLDGTGTDVPLMRQSAKLPYAEVDGHQVVELPYANGETSMVVVVPAAGEFEDFEASLTVDRLATMLDALSEAQVDLALPRFAVESKFSLVEAMRALGVELAFTGGADFGGMADGGGLSISDIVHQCFVEVDELGTEAAAATAVVVAESAAARRVELTVDRPFLFYVRDRPTETPLFVGRVVTAPEPA